jgi:cyanophycinase
MISQKAMGEPISIRESFYPAEPTNSRSRNPRLLGVGIDEDTAIVMDGKEQFQVIGSGGVYVLDGHGVNFTNISEEESGRAISIFGIRLDVLSQGDLFDIRTRQPSSRFASTVAARQQN